MDSLYGLSKENLDNDNPLREVFSSSSTSGLEMYNLVNSYDKDNDGTITAEELKSVNKLTIDGSSNITSLKDLYNLVSLQELTIDSKNFNNLDGIQNCIQLNYVYFKTSTIDDYSALKGLSNDLKYLYFYNINDSEMSKVCDNLKGIGGQDFNSLEYLAFSGTTSRICKVSNAGELVGDNYDLVNKNENLTTINPLDNLTDSTCLAVKSLSLQNNSIISLAPLKRFKNVEVLRAEKNNIISLSGLEGMSSLNNLFLQENELGKEEEILGDNNKDGIDDGVSNTNSLKALESLKELTLLGLSKNTSLKFIHYIFSSDKIKTLTLDNVLYLESNSLCSIKKIIENCQYKIIPSKYSLLLLDDSTTALDLSNQTLEMNQFGLLKNNTNILDLNLSGLIINDKEIALTGDSLNETINSVLETMTSIKNLSLRNIKISDMSFVKSLTELIRIDLIGTNLSTELTDPEGNNIGLELLNNSLNLRRLMFDGVADLSLLQEIIDRCDDTSNYSSVFNWMYFYSGFYIANEETLKTLENCYNIASLSMGLYGVSISTKLDLSHLNNLKKVNFVCLSPSLEGILLPSSVSEVRVSNGRVPDLIYCTNLQILGLHNASVAEGNWSNINFYSERDDIEVSMSYTGFSSQDLNFLDGRGISKLVLNNVIESSCDFDCFNISLPNLSELYISNEKSVSRDLGGIRNFTTLTKLQVSNCGIDDISGIENLRNLESLDLSNNSISNLNNLKDLKSLTTLNLNKNLIYNTSAITEDGDIFTIKNLEILGDLNPLAGKGGHLLTLYLGENGGITDYTPVSKYKNWVAKSGF